MMFHLLVKLRRVTRSIIEVLCCWMRDSLSRRCLSKTFWTVRCVPTGGQRSKISYTLNLRFSRGFCFTLMKSEGGGTRLWSKRPRGDGGTWSQQMSEEMSRHWSSTRLSRGGTKEPVQPWKRGPCPPGVSQQWHPDFFNVYSRSFWSRQRQSTDSYAELLFQDLLLWMNEPALCVTSSFPNQATSTHSGAQEQKQTQ